MKNIWSFIFKPRKIRRLEKTGITENHKILTQHLGHRLPRDESNNQHHRGNKTTIFNKQFPLENKS